MMVMMISRDKPTILRRERVGRQEKHSSPLLNWLHWEEHDDSDDKSDDYIDYGNYSTDYIEMNMMITTVITQLITLVVG